ncbi:Glyoxalase 2-5 [Cymbomonas tetramitiformis]|uniref:Glyoxalase 2-5 n=1 Tax=Cymbomonas tetramitiformis TaxID=36881 RepID=A0AAE0FM95_9CHLO|nr:Glyoxalase 2-5 [Cymbomonas tetramitiformis]
MFTLSNRSASAVAMPAVRAARGKHCLSADALAPYSATSAKLRSARRLSTSAINRCASTATDVTASFQIELVPCLSDNYAYLLHEPRAGLTAIVDPSEAGPVLETLKQRGLTLDYILNTHHHWDHVGGNEELKQQTGASVVGPFADKERIPSLDIALADGETWKFGEQDVSIMDTPGHTRGHIAFYLPGAQAVFTGDTLFALGCGRLFEGTAKQMWKSLSQLAELPPETKVCLESTRFTSRKSQCGDMLVANYY